MNSIATLIKFVDFTHKIRQVRRAIILEDEVNENDMEHSYQMALVAWFIIENNNLQLDKFKVIGMAMMHDIVEAYNGDISAFADPEKIKAHKAKEPAAIKDLKSDWPTFKSLAAFIDEYEECATKEAKFVYSLDKLLPTINNYLYEGKAWKAQNLNMSQIFEFKVGKIDKSLEINNYWQQMKTLLEQKPNLFVKK